MSLILSDRVKEQSITLGTGNISLGGAYGGFQTFSSAIGNGNETYYVIENEFQWEVGRGTYTSSTNSLSRDEVFASSNGNNKIVLNGASIVFCSYPAKKAVAKDKNGYINLSSESGILYSNAIISNTGVKFDDVEVSGTLTLSAYDNQPLTIKRTTAGNFFHAYKDDAYDRTVALYTDGLISPTWKLGVKTSPSDFTAPPDIGYIYGTDGQIGLVANSSNKITISNSTSFTVKHQNVDMLTASYVTGVHINSTANNYPALIVNGGALLSNNIQEWQSYAGTKLSVVNKDGKIGIKRDNPVYDLDVDGSGRLKSVWTSGIYFSDGTYQSTASVTLDFTDKILANTASGIAISGWAKAYIDSQDHSATAVSGWANARDVAISGWATSYTNAGDAAVSGWANARDAAISGWADSTMTTRDAAISGWAASYTNTGDAAVSGWASARDTAISGWADSTITARDTAVSGWAKAYVDGRDIAVSGWAHGTFLTSSSIEFTYISGVAVYASGLAGTGGGDVTTEQLQYVSGIAVYASEQADQNSSDIITVSGLLYDDASISGYIDLQDAAVSGWVKAYVDSQDHSATAVSGWASARDTAISGWATSYTNAGDAAVSGWAKAYVDSQDHSATAVSGWADSYIQAVSGYAQAYTDAAVTEAGGYTAWNISDGTVAGDAISNGETVYISGVSGITTDYSSNLLKISAASLSGWADSAMDTRDAAVSGWADSTMTSRDNAVSGWADATMTARDSAVSGWADTTMTTRDSAVSGWANNTFNLQGVTNRGNTTTNSIFTSGNITAISGFFDVIGFNLNNESTLTKGQIKWDDTEGTVDVGLTNNSIIHIGEHRYYRVRNTSSYTLYKGQVVYATGVNPNGLIAPGLYIANDTIDEVRFIGMVLEDINNNNNGYVIDFGHMENMDLDGSATNYAVGDETWVAGDILYAHPTVSGKLTKVEPKHAITVAIILDAGNGNGNGRLFVRPSTYGDLNDNHNVNISGVTNGQFLQYDSATDYWVPSSSGNFEVLQVNDVNVVVSGDNVSLFTNDSNYATSSYVDSRDAAISGWANARDTSISGWADSTMTTRDNAVSGWADSTMTTRDNAVSGWAASYTNAGDAAVSGWANARDTSISGWADSTMTTRDSAISGWADSTMTTRDNAVSGWANSTFIKTAYTGNSGVLLQGTVFNANLVDYTVQSTSANSRTTTSSRTYAVQVDSSNKLVVNVPWVDTNTTYSAGTNLSLSGTTFNVNDAFLVNNANDTTTGTVTMANLIIGNSGNIGSASDTDAIAIASDGEVTMSQRSTFSKAVKTRILSNTDGTTVTFDLNEANTHTVTLGGSRTLALSNASVGQKFVIRLVQDGAGNRTVTWFSTIKWPGGLAPTLTTTGSKTDVFGFICTSVGNYDGFVIGYNL